ncbi:MAG: ABC transporter permease [Candidatus Limnocylindria bacterium]|nr:ABC transporter permease [Candidatus Limnocylindria bacterium]
MTSGTSAGPTAPPARRDALAWAAGPAIPAASVLIALVLGAAFVLVSGNDPVAAYAALARGAFGTPYDITETLIIAIPLTLGGLSVALAFRTGLFNIGAQSQLLVGALATGFVGVRFADLPGPLLMPLVVLTGIVAGGAWGALAGWLKATRGVNEVITTIMQNYTVVFVMHWLLQNGPMSAPNAFGTPASARIGDGAVLPVIIPAELIPLTRLHAGILLAALAVVAFWFILFRTTLGYELRAVGLGPRAAAQAGIDPKRGMILGMFVAGGFAGLAGMVQVSGVFQRVYDGFSAGYGFDAIAVALLGKNSPIGIVLAALLFGAFARGGTIMQSNAHISSNLVAVIEALVLFVIAAETVLRQLARRHGAAKKTA